MSSGPQPYSTRTTRHCAHIKCFLKKPFFFSVSSIFLNCKSAHYLVMETSLCSTVGASTRTVNVDLGCLGCDAGGGSHVCGAGAGEFGQSLEEVAWERSIWSVSILFFSATSATSLATRALFSSFCLFEFASRALIVRLDCRMSAFPHHCFQKKIRQHQTAI